MLNSKSNIKELLTDLQEFVMAVDSMENFMQLVTIVNALRERFMKEPIYVMPSTKSGYKFYELMTEYGLDKTEVSRILNCYDKYFADNQLMKPFKEYTKWKLYYLLPLETKRLYELIRSKELTPDSSVRKIRRLVSKNKGIVEKEITEDVGDVDFDVEKIPKVFDPSNPGYDYAYFEKMSNEARLRTLWEMYNFIHRPRVVKAKRSKK